MDDAYGDLGTLFKALGDPTRYRIVQLLLQRQHCPRSLALTLGISESAVSQQMSILRKAGLVSSYRHGYHIHYVLCKDAFIQIVDELQNWLDSSDDTLGCHGTDSCRYRLDDGSDGCLYRSSE